MVNLIYIKLKNFEALPICMGRDEIEIDRSDSPNNLILIKGQNGSGKSTLLQELTPFAIENTLSRNSRRIMRGKDGLKELHFLVDNRYIYNCRIIYTDKKTSAYISKQDLASDDLPEELNPNGNISTYEDILESELGLRKSYQKIGYLSPDIINFIAMKAAERSHYVSSIMPDISIYLKGYEIVSKKANEKRREIENINKELGKLSTINYENHLNELKLKLENIESILDKTKSDITKCEVYINNLEKYKYDFDKLDEMMHKHDILYNQLTIEKNKIQMSRELVSKYSGKDSNDKLNNDISTLTESLAANREREYHLEQRIEKLTLSIREKTSHIDPSNEVKESLDEILNYIDKYQIDLKELELLLEELKSTNERIISIFENMETNTVYEFSRIMDFIIDYSNKIENNQYDLNAIQIISNNYQTEYENLTKSITDKEQELKDTIEKISLLKSNEDMKHLYSLKPAACMASTCKIIEELEKYINVSNERELLIKHKELLENTRSFELKKKEELETDMFNIKQNLRILISINDFLNNNSNIIITFSEYLKDIFKKDLNIIIDTMKRIKIDFNSFREYLHMNDKVNVLRNSLNELKIKKNNVISKNSLDKEVQELENEKSNLVKLRELIQSQEIEKESLEKISETKLKIEKDIENYNKNTLILKNYADKILAYSKIKYYYKHLKDIYIQIQCDKTIKEKEKQELEKERETLKTEYVNKQQLESLRNSMLDVKKKYDVLSSIWSSKTGYPSILMENFLLKLKEETNQDLAEIWDNSLSIEDFVLSQTEFSIVMNKNGAIIPDASQCSQGEKAILSLALSFAIIEMGLSERKYNIVRMDEADGPLDSVRARFFLTMLQNRLKKMNDATAFVITHKDEFDEVNADMILLKNTDLNIINNEINKNKNIIFKL